MSEFILVLAMLTTESSYKSEVERPVTTVPDTAQFWIGSPEPWRIRTYAIDYDIHVYAIGLRPDGTSFQSSDAEEHIRKHYADVTRKIYILKFKDPKNQKEVAAVLAEQGLSGSLEVAPSGFSFYNPDRGTYKTMSAPK